MGTSDNEDLLKAIKEAAYEMRQDFLLLRLLMLEAKDRGLDVPAELTSGILRRA